MGSLKKLYSAIWKPFIELTTSATREQSIGDLSVAGSHEGDPVPFCMGPEAHCPAQIIWADEITQWKVKEDAGGKGGGKSGESTSLVYWVDLMYALCETSGEGGERLRKLWIGKKLAYNTDPSPTVTAANLVASVFEAGLSTYLKIESPDGGEDLSVFQSGSDVVISGWSSGGNNGTFKVIAAYFDPLTSKTYLEVLNAGATAESAGASVTITQELPVSISGGYGGAITSFTFLDGNAATQTPSSTIEAVEGDGEVPAHLYMATIGVDNLQLAEFGNSVPRQIEALIEMEPFTTLASACSKLLDRAGVDPDLYDTTQVSGELRGFTWATGPAPTRDLLRPLVLAYDLVPYIKQNVLYIASHAALEVLAINPDDIGARQPGDQWDRPMRLTEADILTLPSQINVSYTDPSVLYETASQRSTSVVTTHENVQTVDLTPLVLTATEARGIAQRLFWAAHSQRQEWATTLPASYVGKVRAGMILTWTIGGEDWRMLVMRCDRGANMIMEISGVLELDASFLLHAVSGEDQTGLGGSDVITPPGHVAHEIVDIAPLVDTHAESPHLYHAAALSDDDLVFKGGGIYESKDSGATYALLSSLSAETTMGWATDALGDSSPGITDRANTVTVQMIQGTLESTTELATQNGINWAVLGDEVIGFATATLTGYRTYTLSVLLRGLRDTQEDMGGHAVGDRFILLESNSITAQSVNLGALGTARDYKALSVGADIADVDAQTVTVGGNSIRPFAPAWIGAIRNDPTAGDWSGSWDPRTRANVRVFQEAPIDLLESSEVYEVDVLDTGVPTRTITSTASGGGSVITGRTFLYTDDDQTTDFGSDQSSITLVVYQVSSSYGRGRGRQITFTA